jgi:hypothetical protein
MSIIFIVFGWIQSGVTVLEQNRLQMLGEGKAPWDLSNRVSLPSGSRKTDWSSRITKQCSNWKTLAVSQESRKEVKGNDFARVVDRRDLPAP